VACTVVLAGRRVLRRLPPAPGGLESFQVAAPGQPAKYGLDGWRARSPSRSCARPYSTRSSHRGPQIVSLALAILIAWLIARTDLPGRNWIEFAFWAAFFLPTLTVTLSWILLLDPDYGLVNTRARRPRLVSRGPFDLYSFWGIVWIHVITGSLTVKVILLTPAVP